MRVRRVAEMRYVGQGHEVEAAIPPGRLTPESVAPITAAFEAAYQALYHRRPSGVPVEALNWRITAAGPAPDLPPGPAPAAPRPAAAAVKGTRPAFFIEAGGFVPAPVYDRYALGPGAEFAGPAIVEERESTAVIGPGARCRVAEDLTLVVEVPW